MIPTLRHNKKSSRACPKKKVNATAIDLTRPLVYHVGFAMASL